MMSISPINSGTFTSIHKTMRNFIKKIANKTKNNNLMKLAGVRMNTKDIMILKRAIDTHANAINQMLKRMAIGSRLDIYA